MAEDEAKPDKVKRRNPLPGAASHLHPSTAGTGVDDGEKRPQGKLASGKVGLLSRWERSLEQEAWLLCLLWVWVLSHRT